MLTVQLAELVVETLWKDAGLPAGPDTSSGESHLPVAQGPYSGGGKEAISGLCGEE